MNSKLEQMKSASKSNLEEAMNTPQATFVLDSNWRAVIAQLTLLTQAVEQVSKEVTQTMTAEQMNYHLENQQVIFNQVKSECRHIQQTTAEQTANSLTSLISQSEKLSLQAGKLNEEYYSKLKESEERNMKRSRKLIGIVIAIQSVQLILWTALQVLLR